MSDIRVSYVQQEVEEEFVKKEDMAEHDHNDQYYTKSEVDAKLSEKADGSDEQSAFWTGTKAEYDALPIKDAGTVYFIID